MHRHSSSRLFTMVTYIGLLAFAMTGNALSARQRELPPWVEEAIRIGSTKKVKPYPLERKWLGMGATLGAFTTPFLRVAIAASEAREKLTPFDTSSVTDEMLADTLVVYVFPLFGEKMNDTHRAAEHVVIKKAKSKDPKDAVQPTSVAPFNDAIWNLGGARLEKQGLIATFPLSAFQQGWAFYIVYEDTPWTGDKFELRITREMIERTTR